MAEVPIFSPLLLPQAIKNAKAALSQTRYGPDAISIQLAQIGNDMASRAFLEEIDNHPDIGGLVDVSAFSGFRAESRARGLTKPSRTDDFQLRGGIWLVGYSGCFRLTPPCSQNEADDFMKTTGQELTP